MKKESALSQCEKTENQAEQNKPNAVAGIEAHPTPPHGCFFRNDRGNLTHADLQLGVTGRELCPPERISEVDDAERKDNARTNNHENFCGQDALPLSFIFGSPSRRMLHLGMSTAAIPRLHSMTKLRAMPPKNPSSFSSGSV